MVRGEGIVEHMRQDNRVRGVVVVEGLRVEADGEVGEERLEEC